MLDKYERLLGAMLLGIALLAFLEMVEVIRGEGRYLWPGLILMVGLFGRLKAPPKNQISVVLLIGGAGEIIRVAGFLPVLSGLVWPGALFLSGISFLRKKNKKEEGLPEELLRLFGRLGGALLLAGAARTIGIISGIHKGTVELGWIIPTLAAGFLWLQIPTLREEDT